MTSVISTTILPGLGKKPGLQVLRHLSLIHIIANTGGQSQEFDPMYQEFQHWIQEIPTPFDAEHYCARITQEKGTE